MTSLPLRFDVYRVTPRGLDPWSFEVDAEELRAVTWTRSHERVVQDVAQYGQAVVQTVDGQMLVVVPPMGSPDCDWSDGIPCTLLSRYKALDAAIEACDYSYAARLVSF